MKDLLGHPANAKPRGRTNGSVLQLPTVQGESSTFGRRKDYNICDYYAQVVWGVVRSYAARGWQALDDYLPQMSDKADAVLSRQA